MGEFSLFHWLVVLGIVVLLFGAGRLPRVMGDFAKGIKAFKTAIKEDEARETKSKPQVQSPPSYSASGSEQAAQEHDRVDS